MIPGFLWGGNIARMPAGGKLRYGTLSEGMGMDFFLDYQKQIELLARQGMSALCIPVLWEQIMPDEGGAPNDDALALYDRVIAALVQHNIEPILCLYQSDMPKHLRAQYAGWQAREVLDAYIGYATEVIKHFAPSVQLFLPIANVNVAPYLDVMLQGPLAGREADVCAAEFHMLLACSHVARLARTHAPNAQVGAMINYISFYPESPHPADALCAQRMEEDYCMRTLEVIMRGRYTVRQLHSWCKTGEGPIISHEDWEQLQAHTMDFLAFGYHMSCVVSHSDPNNLLIMEVLLSNGVPRDPVLESNFSWSVDPTGLHYAMQQLYNRYQKPLFVVDSGMGMAKEPTLQDNVQDGQRIEYLCAHLKSMQDAMLTDGIPCMGFLAWSPIDLVTANEGGSGKRFGFVHAQEGEAGINYTPKDSYAWFADVVQTNATNIIAEHI